jgi:molybdenum cofactor synthesis domain-containing protein
LTKRFHDYVSLKDALRILRRNASVSPRKELVPLGQAYGRVLYQDVVSRYDIPVGDSAHMDGFAVRSRDLVGASVENPVELRSVRGSSLGIVPKRSVRSGDAHTVLTGGYMPEGADAVVQVERTQSSGRKVRFSRAPAAGEFVYAKGRDVRKGELVLPKGRSVRGSDLVLLGSLHIDRVPVYRRPRIAVVPTGNELTEDIRDARPGKVVETHGFLLSRLIDGAGGVSVQMPIALDDVDAIKGCVRAALKTADVVLTLAGSSVGEADLTENAIDSLGAPGVLVHGMKVHRGRVMGFGAVGGKAIIILPGPIQGASNAFAMMAYPLIRSYLGRGFEEPASLPATMGNAWDAGERYPNFSKVVYVKVDSRGPGLKVIASAGETEKVTFLTQNDGYILVDEATVTLKKGDPVRVHLLPGLSPS